jgi:hypothetical protein
MSDRPGLVPRCWMGVRRVDAGLWRCDEAPLHYEESQADLPEVGAAVPAAPLYLCVDLPDEAGHNQADSAESSPTQPQ